MSIPNTKTSHQEIRFRQISLYLIFTRDHDTALPSLYSARSMKQQSTFRHVCALSYKKYTNIFRVRYFSRRSIEWQLIAWYISVLFSWQTLFLLIPHHYLDSARSMKQQSTFRHVCILSYINIFRVRYFSLFIVWQLIAWCISVIFVWQKDFIWLIPYD